MWLTELSWKQIYLSKVNNFQTNLPTEDDFTMVPFLDYGKIELLSGINLLLKLIFSLISNMDIGVPGKWLKGQFVN